jgi:hypothetical protein
LNYRQHAIQRRHGHHGYMAEYRVAIQLVRQTIEDETQEPLLASWF